MRALSILFLLVLIAGAAMAVIQWQPAVDPIERPLPASFDRAAVARGAELVAVADCHVCHTTAEGKSYAGGLPIPTPYGTIYSTNITPDPDTGIGRWSEAALARAVRQGVGRRGVQLYPALPYEHFNTVSDEDVKSIYAFLMTREAVAAKSRPTELHFPFNLRPLVAGWKLLYLEKPHSTAGSTRGQYLVQGLGHCGACHTPRNALGAEKKTEAFSGGETDGWVAPPLDATSPSPLRWTDESLYRYLRFGLADDHGIPAGPMGPVAHNLADANDDDVRAMASYVASLMPAVEPAREKRIDERIAAIHSDYTASAGTASAVGEGAASGLGAILYDGACASCHDRGRALSSSGTALYLPLATTLYMATPRNLLRIVMEGITPLDGERGRWMPRFDAAFTDEQLAALAIFLRARFGEGPMWTNVADEVKQARRRVDG